MIVEVIESGPEGNNKKLCKLLYRLNSIYFNNKNYELKLISFKNYTRKYSEIIKEDTLDIIYNDIINILKLQEPEYIIRYSYQNIQEIKNYNKFVSRKHRKKNIFWTKFVQNILCINLDICNIISEFIYS